MICHRQRGGRVAELIVDNLDRTGIWNYTQLKHSVDEAWPSWAIQPTGPRNQVIGAEGSHSYFTGEFTSPINTPWACSVELVVGTIEISRKNIVG
jgi:hypothetical protein